MSLLGDQLRARRFVTVTGHSIWQRGRIWETGETSETSETGENAVVIVLSDPIVNEKVSR